MAAESDQTGWQLPEPCWRPEDLGRAMPDSPHAASVCMPLWEHNIAYEEGEPGVLAAFRSGYPRFFLNPLVRELRQVLADRHGQVAERCLPLPSAGAAARCAEYVRQRTGEAAVIEADDHGVWLVHTGAAGTDALREFWQHAGEIVSSRTAEHCLRGGCQLISETPARREVRERIADLQGVSARDVFLFPSGMAAIHAAWRVSDRGQGVPVQFGFPYVDTFKILERFGSETPLFYPRGTAADLDALEGELARRQVSAVFCEAPGNPLLTTPDLRRLSDLSARYGFLVVVDDTLGAMLNTDVRPWADLVATSLTKFFSGRGDVLAGSLTVVPHRRRYAELRQWLDENSEDLLADPDVAALAENSRDVRPRVRAMNAAARTLATALRRHPAVEQVWYPTETTADRYEQIRDRKDPDAGYGGLLSVLLRDAERTTAAVYDALRVSKGPNLGTNFTLCCPYTLLAHYHELPFAEQCGVSRYLLRISAGLEGAEWLVARVLEAIDRVC